MIRSIAGISPGAHGEARASGSEPAVWSKPDMSTKESSGGKPSVTIHEESTRQEPNGNGIGLWGHDISGDEGELLAIYSPDGGAMDGEILYARPRDLVGLEGNR